MLSEAGIPVTVMTAPIIPALNEPEMERLLEAAAAAGRCARADYVLLRLPLEIADSVHAMAGEALSPTAPSG